ncbi:MAG: STAS domain-containing protein [SAR324 cluster bacterium]|nr:STAS domain-containing protein [SAR324 cluster bacterium]
MNLEEKVISGDTLIITVDGDLATYAEIDQLRKVLTSRGQKNMIINLKLVSLLSSLAIAMMIMGFKQSDARQGKFILCHAPNDVLESLKNMGLFEVLTFADTEKDALDLLEN